MFPLRPSGEGCSQLMMIAVELTALPVGVSGGLVGTTNILHMPNYVPINLQCFVLIVTFTRGL